MKGKLTIGELIETLKRYPKDTYVALSVDTEGNSYSIMMDRQCIIPNCYMQDELGSQYDFYDKAEVNRAKRNGKKTIKHKWEREEKQIDSLVPVVILIGSN